MSLSRFILILCLAFGTAPAHAERVVLVIGDSLSAGYGLSQDQSWPALLQRRLVAQRLPYRVVNASTSGDTTANGRSRLAAALAQHRPAVVIIALGANDGLRGLPVASMGDNLVAMARAIRSADARLVLVGMDMPPNYGPDYRRRFSETFAQVAREQKAALVPFMLAGFGERRELFQSDGIHPTADAQPLILENIWPALKPLLR